jgi:hypothetical protein
LEVELAFGLELFQVVTIRQFSVDVGIFWDPMPPLMVVEEFETRIFWVPLASFVVVEGLGTCVFKRGLELIGPARSCSVAAVGVGSHGVGPFFSFDFLITYK